MFIYGGVRDNSCCFNIGIDTIIARVGGRFPCEYGRSVSLMNFTDDVELFQIQKIGFFNEINTSDDCEENNTREKEIMFHTLT